MSRNRLVKSSEDYIRSMSYLSEEECHEIKVAYQDGAEWALRNPSETYAWKLYNFISDWKSGSYGAIDLQEAINKHLVILDEQL